MPTIPHTLGFTIQDLRDVPFRVSTVETIDGIDRELSSLTIDHVGDYSLDFVSHGGTVNVVWTKAVSSPPTVTLTVLGLHFGHWTYEPGEVYVQLCNSRDPYEFGFNGKYKNNEIAGTGNSLDYGFRMYNPRLAKFESVDPLTKKFPYYTPYQFAGNTPIMAVDLEGLEILPINTSMYRMKTLGNIARISLTSDELLPAYRINIVERNIPAFYPIQNSFNVGTNGYDNPNAKLYDGPIFYPTGGDPTPHEGNPFEATGEQKGSDVKVVKLPRIIGGPRPVVTPKEELSTAAAGAVEFLKWSKDIIKGHAELYGDMKEKTQRDAFYKATKMVDAVLNSSIIQVNVKELHNSVENLRSDLINYITDGTAPSSHDANMSKGDMKQYDTQVQELGNIMLKSNNEPVRSK